MMLSRFFIILMGIIISLILLGGVYIYLVIFGGKVPVNLPQISYYEIKDTDPINIAFDNSLKLIYITTQTGEIKKYSLSEDKIIYISSIGKFGNDKGQFRSPIDIEVDKNNFMYILDSYLSKLTKMDNNGKVIWEVGKFGNNEENFANPEGIGLDKLGFIYIADSRNNRIVKYDLDSNFLLLFGKEGKEPSQFNNPSDIVIDSKGFLYVLDKGNNRIQVFDSNSNFISFLNLEIDISKVNRLYIDENDFIYFITNEEIFVTNKDKIIKKIDAFFDKKKHIILNVFKWINKIYILYKNTLNNTSGIKIIEIK